MAKAAIAKGLFLGLITGAAGAILMAPKSGRLMREDIKDRSDSALDYIKHLIWRSRASVSEAAEDAKEVAEVAKSKQPTPEIGSRL